MTFVILDGRPGAIGGDLALPNNRIFFRMLVTDRSLHFATLAICGVVSFFLLHNV